MTEGKSSGSTVATRSPTGSDAAPALFDAGCAVSVGVAVGVGVLVGVAVGVAVAVAVSVGRGVSLAGGTAVSVAGIINAGIGVGSSPLQAAPNRRITNRLTISLWLIRHLGKEYKRRLLAAVLYTTGTIFPETPAYDLLAFPGNDNDLVYGAVIFIS